MLEIPFYNYSVKTQTLSKLYMVYLKKGSFVQANA